MGGRDEHGNGISGLGVVTCNTSLRSRFQKAVAELFHLEHIVRVGDEGIDGIRSNATVVVLVTSHLNVATIAPGG